MTHTKTYKIGELARGGVITVEIKGKIITVIGKEWDFSTGSRKSSDQSNAKEFTRGTVLSSDEDVRYKLMDLLNDLTTSFYAEMIFSWIESKIKLETSLYW